MEMSIQEVRTFINNNVTKVTFRKKNGDLREMLCSTKKEFMPEGDPSKYNKVNDSVVTVWDLEKGAWRSFRYDSIQDIYVA